MNRLRPISEVATGTYEGILVRSIQRLAADIVGELCRKRQEVLGKTECRILLSVIFSREGETRTLLQLLSSEFEDLDVCAAIVGSVFRRPSLVLKRGFREEEQPFIATVSGTKDVPIVSSREILSKSLLFHIFESQRPPKERFETILGVLNLVV